MYLKTKNLIEHLTGLTIYRKSTPWGLNLCNDIERYKSDWSPKITFDVGANVGQTALAFSKQWPNTKIFSFEPVRDTFATLQKTVRGLSNIEAVNLALGSIPGEKHIKIFPNSLLATLDHQVFEPSNTNFEIVKVSTVDEFCASHFIPRIDLLKIDTEGYDLEVLRGSVKLLEAGNIDFILSEISSSTFPGKISVTDMEKFLKDYGMICIGIYDQAFWHQARIYYGNALFAKETLFK